MTHDEYQVERMQPPEMPPGAHCCHDYVLHGGSGCEEALDEFRRCGCPSYEPAAAEDLRQDEFPEEL